MFKALGKTRIPVLVGLKKKIPGVIIKEEGPFVIIAKEPWTGSNGELCFDDWVAKKKGEGYVLV